MWPGELKSLLMLGEDRCIFRMKESDGILEIFDVEPFPLENLHYISGFILDFERNRLYKPSPNLQSRRRLLLPARDSAEKSPPDPESDD